MIKKRVTIIRHDFYNTGGVVETIYEEGIPFPSDWEWLSNLMTDWTVKPCKSSKYSLGVLSDEILKSIYGDDVKIVKLI